MQIISKFLVLANLTLRRNQHVVVAACIFQNFGRLSQRMTVSPVILLEEKRPKLLATVTVSQNFN